MTNIFLALFCSHVFSDQDVAVEVVVEVAVEDEVEVEEEVEEGGLEEVEGFSHWRQRRHKASDVLDHSRGFNRLLNNTSGFLVYGDFFKTLSIKCSYWTVENILINKIYTCIYNIYNIILKLGIRLRTKNLRSEQ